MTQCIAVRALSELPRQERVCVAGRVVAASSADFTLQDHTGCVRVEAAPPPLGAFARVTGTWAESDALTAAEVETLTAGSSRFTSGDSEWGFLMGVRLPYLHKRHQLTRAVRNFFDTREFLEVDTPAIVPCPGLDVHLDAIEVLGARGPRWLHTSPEYQMKRLLTLGLPGIYQLGKAFRRGERGRLHEPEFTMLEWYRSFSDAEQMMRDTEQLVAAVARELTGGTELPGVEGPVDVTPPWDRITVQQAFQRYAGIELASVLSDEEEFYQVLADSVEPKLGRKRAVFLTDYPAPMASLARLSPTDPHFAERFEAYLDGIELCNGFSELVDPAEQRRRFERDQETREKLDRAVYPVDERFLAALQEGIPPSGGNALGFDRLLMLLVGAKHIDEVMALPTSRM
jgi:lysyl-tRNA synthetase class 2